MRSHASNATCDQNAAAPVPITGADSKMLAARLDGVDCTAYLAANASSKDAELVVVLKSTSTNAPIFAEVCGIYRLQTADASGMGRYYRPL